MTDLEEFVLENHMVDDMIYIDDSADTMLESAQMIEEDGIRFELLWAEILDSDEMMFLAKALARLNDSEVKEHIANLEAEATDCIKAEITVIAEGLDPSYDECNITDFKIHREAL